MRTVEMEAVIVDDGEDPTEPMLSSGVARTPLVWWQTLCWVALGGALGSALRYLLGLLLPTVTTPTLVEFPGGTLLGNVLGCLGLGILYGYLERRPDAPVWVRPLVGPGLLGSFASFSFLILTGSAMVGADFPVMALVYGGVTLVCALGGVAIGSMVGVILGPTAIALRNTDTWRRWAEHRRHRGEASGSGDEGTGGADETRVGTDDATGSGDEAPGSEKGETR
jgi:CrcB protein